MITAKPLSVTFTAPNDGLAFATYGRFVVGCTFWGVGLTPTQQITLRDSEVPGAGSILVDYVTDATLDNADLWVGRVPQKVYGLSLDNLPLDGTWALTVFLWDEKQK